MGRSFSCLVIVIRENYCKYSPIVEKCAKYQITPTTLLGCSDSIRYYISVKMKMMDWQRKSWLTNRKYVRVINVYNVTHGKFWLFHKIPNEKLLNSTEFSLFWFSVIFSTYSSSYLCAIFSKYSAMTITKISTVLSVSVTSGNPIN